MADKDEEVGKDAQNTQNSKGAGSPGNAEPEIVWRVGEVLPPMTEPEKVCLPKLVKVLLIENFVPIITAVFGMVIKGNLAAFKLLFEFAMLVDSEEPVTETVVDSFALRLIEAAKEEREKLETEVSD